MTHPTRMVGQLPLKDAIDRISDDDMTKMCLAVNQVFGSAMANRLLDLIGSGAVRSKGRWRSMKSDIAAIIETGRDMPANDLNTPGVIALMHGYRARKEGTKLFATLRFMGFFGGTCLPDEVKTLPQDHIWQTQLIGPDAIGVEQ